MIILTCRESEFQCWNLHLWARGAPIKLCTFPTPPHPQRKVQLQSAFGKMHWGKCGLIWVSLAAGKIPEGLKYTTASSGSTENCLWSLLAIAEVKLHLENQSIKKGAMITGMWPVFMCTVKHMKISGTPYVWVFGRLKHLRVFWLGKKNEDGGDEHDRLSNVWCGWR